MSLSESEWAEIGKKLLAYWVNIEDEPYLEHYINCDKCGIEGSWGEISWNFCSAWEYRDNDGIPPVREKTQLDKNIEAVYGHTLAGYMAQEIKVLKNFALDDMVRFTGNKEPTIIFPIRKETDGSDDTVS